MSDYLNDMRLLIGLDRPQEVEFGFMADIPWKHVSFARFMALQAVRLRRLNHGHGHDLIVRAAWECHGPGITYYAPKKYLSHIFKQMVAEYMTAATDCPMRAINVELPEWLIAELGETSA